MMLTILGVGPGALKVSNPRISGDSLNLKISDLAVKGHVLLFWQPLINRSTVYYL